MKKQTFHSKINLAIVASLLLLIVLGCQPSGGELLPLPEDGVEITTSRFENDTAVIIKNDVTVKFYGSWNGEHNYQLRVVVFNSSDKTVRIVSDKFIAESVEAQDKPLSVSVKKYDGKTLISTETVYENYNANDQKKIPSFEIKAGDKKSFVVGFMKRFGGGVKYDSPDRLVSFSLPVQKGREPLFYFKANFRGVSEKSEHHKPDPNDW